MARFAAAERAAGEHRILGGIGKRVDRFGRGCNGRRGRVAVDADGLFVLDGEETARGTVPEPGRGVTVDDEPQRTAGVFLDDGEGRAVVDIGRGGRRAAVLDPAHAAAAQVIPARMVGIAVFAFRPGLGLGGNRQGRAEHQQRCEDEKERTHGETSSFAVTFVRVRPRLSKAAGREGRLLWQRRLPTPGS